MKKSEDFIIRRLKNKAHKYALPTEHSHYFEDLPKEKKDHYDVLIANFSIGTPILLFETIDNKWTILGSQKVIGYDGRIINEMPFNHIDKITSGPIDRVRRNNQTQLEVFKKNELSKSEIGDVAVYDFVGNTLNFYANKGSDLFSLWNILLLAVQLNNNEMRVK